jgi:putative ABC transport system permease protein
MAIPLYYNVRNVRVRWQVTLLAVGGIALVVAVFAVLMSMSEGFRAALRSTGRTDNAIIVQRGSASELTSGVPLDDRNKIVVDERIARDSEGRPLASWEWVVVIGLPKLSDGVPTNITLRAVTPRAFEVRGGIELVEGRTFTPGLDEVIVGRKLVDRVEGMAVGETVKYQQKRFEIVGLFESRGGAFESEIWGDFDTLGAIFQRGAGSNSLVVRMKDPATIPELDRWIRDQP